MSKFYGAIGYAVTRRDSTVSGGKRLQFVITTECYSEYSTVSEFG